ncbi:MAG: tetratricopeptide repeat protein [Cyanobacteria bacterium P01_F01_bin.150]
MLYPLLKSPSTVTFLIILTVFTAIQPVMFKGQLAIAQTIESESSADEKVAEADRLLMNGIAQISIGELDRALEILQQALEIYQTLGDRAGEGQVFKNLGNIYWIQEDYETALGYQRQALAIAREVQDSDLEARSLSNIGLAHRDLGNSEEELKALQQAFAIVLADQNSELLKNILTQLRITLFQQGEYQQLVDYAHQMLRLAREVGDRLAESWALEALALAHHNLEQYQQAIDLYEQQLTIVRKLHDQTGEGRALGNLGAAYADLEQNEQAIDFYKQSLSIAREIGDRSMEGRALGNLGRVYTSLAQYEQAIDFYEQRLAITRELGDRAKERLTLNNLGVVYKNLGQYDHAIDVYEQALSIARELGDRTGELLALDNLGIAYNSLEQYEQAIDFYGQGLSITRELGDRTGERLALNNLGITYANLGQYEQAIDFAEQELGIAGELGDRAEEGHILRKLGILYKNLGQYERSIDFHEQSLSIAHELGDRARQGMALNNLGDANQNLGHCTKAIEFYSESLAIAQELDEPGITAHALLMSGLCYISLGEFQKAIESQEEMLILSEEFQKTVELQEEEVSVTSSQQIDFQAVKAFIFWLSGFSHLGLSEYQQASDLFNQSLASFKETGGYKEFARLSLIGLGYVYGVLGQYQEGIEVFQEQLVFGRQINDTIWELMSLQSLGNLHKEQGEFQSAINFYQAVIEVTQDIGDVYYESLAFAGLGDVYNRQGKYQQALETLEQSLAVRPESDSPLGKGYIWNVKGEVYQNLGEYQKSLENYQKSLITFQEINARNEEGEVLGNIGSLLAESDQIELAITFYKQSVNVRESVRNGIRELPREQRQSFTDTIADDYRALADLLLQQNRILEAQQILDLLKIQELDDFLHSVRSTPDSQITILRPEIAILEKYQELQQSVIILTREQADIYARIRETGDISPANQERLGQIDAILSDLSTQFQAFIDDPDVQKQVKALDIDVQEQTIPLERLTQLQDNLADLNAVMLYPLVLDDRIELIITTPISAPIQRTVQGVSRTQLNDAITAFRLALDDPGSDAITPAQQLYDWLIAPIEADLTAAGLDTIIYAPDGPLRYIPLAALHDGEQWLAGRFRINHITAASIDDLSRPDRTQPVVLAGAFSDPSVSHDVTVGDRTLPFNGLPYAGEEVKSLEETLPNINAHFDNAFDLESLKPLIGAYNILHFATHAAFLPDYPINSFILSGNGKTVSLQSLREQWNFSGIDLVVLSACETGLGGYDNNGEQILGLGYVFQEKGAKAVMASLWQVSDRGTQTLMDAFYAALNNGYGKSEALQRAQQALITGDQTILVNPENSARGERGATLEIIDSHTGRSLTHGSTLSHPYYWAPFILIGNGL